MQITFGKDRYHEHRDMEAWCLRHIGPGSWSYSSPNTWEGMGDKLWIMYSMFGNTTFCFRNPKDYTWFLLNWS